MVDFPIRKWDFWVCGWSGAFWGALERKKEKTKCIYSRPYRGEKKVQALFFPPKKRNIWRISRLRRESVQGKERRKIRESYS